MLGGILKVTCINSGESLQGVIPREDLNHQILKVFLVTDGLIMAKTMTQSEIVNLVSAL